MPNSNNAHVLCTLTLSTPILIYRNPIAIITISFRKKLAYQLSPAEFMTIAG